MRPAKTVLVADVPALRNGPYDMAVIGLHFDQSRMFALLHAAV